MAIVEYMLCKQSIDTVATVLGMFPSEQPIASEVVDFFDFFKLQNLYLRCVLLPVDLTVCIFKFVLP